MQSAADADALLDSPTAVAFIARCDMPDAGMTSLSKLDRDDRRRGLVGDS